jgi:RNA polymerase sigma factor (sigma-70 family)
MPSAVVTDQITFWMNAAGSKPVLSKEEVSVLAKKIKAEKPGSALHKHYVNELVSHNMRLVIRSVHLYMNGKSRKNWGESETMDFLQTGALGLIRAAEKYDPEMGYTFATYATYWIRSFIGRYSIKTSSIFHIPENACRDAYAFEKHGFIKNRSHEYSQIFTDLVRSAQTVVSLDAPVGEDKDMSLVDSLESHYGSEARGVGRFSPEMEDLMRAAELSPDQIKVLEHLYIDDMKIKDIVKISEFPRKVVMALRNTALDKLKSVIPAV